MAAFFPTGRLTAAALNGARIPSTAEDVETVRCTAFSRLAALDAVSLLHLHRSGLLEVVHLLLASQDNLQRLVAEKTRRLAAEG